MRFQLTVMARFDPQAKNPRKPPNPKFRQMSFWKKMLKSPLCHPKPMQAQKGAYCSIVSDLFFLPFHGTFCKNLFFDCSITTFFTRVLDNLIFTWRVRASQTSPRRHASIVKEKVTFWGTQKCQRPRRETDLPAGTMGVQLLSTVRK